MCLGSTKHLEWHGYKGNSHHRRCRPPSAMGRLARDYDRRCSTLKMNPGCAAPTRVPDVNDIVVATPMPYHI